MKNTFKINGISITIDGCPVQMESIEITNESSAQELATNGGLIMSIIKEIKPYIDMAIQANKSATPIANAPTIAAAPKQSNDGIIKAKEPKGTFSLTRVFTKIPRPEILECISYMKYGFKNDKAEVSIDASEYNCIHIHVYAMKKWMHVHVHPTNVSSIGSDIKPEEMDDFLGASGLPVEIQEYIKKLIIL